MAQRTQMRLQAITGSISAIHTASLESQKALPGAIASEDLQGVLAQVAGAINRIHGADAFTNQDAGTFKHDTISFKDSQGTQKVKLAVNNGHVSGSGLFEAGSLSVTGVSTLIGNADLKANLDVDGLATLSGSIVEDLAGKTQAGAVVYAGTDGRLKSDADFWWDPTNNILNVQGSVAASGGITNDALVQNRVVYVSSEGAVTSSTGFTYAYNADEQLSVLGISGSLKVAGGYGSSGLSVDTSGNLDMDGRLLVDSDVLVSGSLKVGADNFTVDTSGNINVEGTSTLDGDVTVLTGNKLIVQDLAPTHVVFVGGSYELVDSADFVFDSAEAALTVGGSTAAGDIVVKNASNVATITLAGEYGDIGVRDIQARSGSFSGHVQITGNLEVLGETVTVNVGTIEVEDQTILINKKGTAMTAQEAGIEIYRGAANAATPAAVLWNESGTRFDLKLGTAFTDLQLQDLTGSSVALSGRLDVDGRVDLGANGTVTAVSGTFAVLQTSAFGDDVVMEHELQVKGITDLDGDVFVGDTATNANLYVSGAVTANSLKINNDTLNHLYLVGASGIEDSANLYYESSKLYVTGGLEVSAAALVMGAFDANGVATFSDNITLDRASKTTISKTGGDLLVMASQHLSMSSGVGADLVIETSKGYFHAVSEAHFESDGYVRISSSQNASDALAVEAFGSGGVFIKAYGASAPLALQAVQNIELSGSDIIMSASSDAKVRAEGGYISLVDQYGLSAAAVSADWADAEGIKLSNNAQEWIDFQDTFGVGKSILGALASGGAGGKFIEAVSYTGTIVSASLLDDASDPTNANLKFGAAGTGAGKWSTIVEPRVLKTDVFVNGQLMVSGSASDVSTNAADYAIAANGDITFSFTLVPDDMVVVKVG